MQQQCFGKQRDFGRSERQLPVMERIMCTTSSRNRGGKSGISRDFRQAPSRPDLDMPQNWPSVV